MIESKQVMFQANDTLVSTKSTSPYLAKSFRFTNLNGVVNDVFVITSAWNDSKDEFTTITVDINGKQATIKASGNVEKVYHKTITLPLGIDIYEFKMYISTSNSNYSAHTQLLEVVGR